MKTFLFKNSFRKYAMLFIIMLFLYGCGDENKDTAIGRLETEVKTLRNENIQLRKNCAKTNISETGILFSAVTIGGVVIVVNNLIWVIIYRKKQC